MCKTLELRKSRKSHRLFDNYTEEKENEIPHLKLDGYSTAKTLTNCPITSGIRTIIF